MTGHRESTYDNTKDYRDMQQALAEKEPHITWVKNRRGVFVATEIDDPHAETQYKPKGSVA